MIMNKVKGILITLAVITSVGVQAETKELTGKQLSEDRKLGNCLACHMIVGGNLAGNIAPPLVAMKARYPDIADLKAQINDPRINNKNSMMPPFGAHMILTPVQLDRLTKYIHTL
jgi:sulfur-oxidizing protein SoxX